MGHTLKNDAVYIECLAPLKTMARKGRLKGFKKSESNTEVLNVKWLNKNKQVNNWGVQVYLYICSWR